MSQSTKYSHYAMSIDGTLLGAITAMQINTGTDIIANPTSGEAFARFAAIRGQKPGVTFSTLAILNAINEMSVKARVIGGDTSPTICYAQKHQAGSTRVPAATVAHKSYTFNDGIFVIRSITASHQADAVCNAELIAMYDGTNDPIVIGADVALPTGANLDDDQRFTLGGVVTVAGEIITQIRSIEIDFGVNLEVGGTDSDIWPTYADIATIEPVITFRGIDPKWLDSAVFPLIGKQATYATTSFYLRQRLRYATYEPDVGAPDKHIKFQAQGLAHVTTALDGSAGGGVETVLVLKCNWDGTNDPITATASDLNA